MTDSFAYHLHVLFVADGRGDLADDMEVVGGVILTVEDAEHVVDARRRVDGPVFGDGHFVPHVVDRDDIPKEDVGHLRNLVNLRLGDLYVFEVGDTIVRSVSEKTVNASWGAGDVEQCQKVVHPVAQRVIFVDCQINGLAVRKLLSDGVSIYGEACDGLYANEGVAVFGGVVVRAFEQHRFGKEITDLQVDAYWGLQVAQKGAALSYDLDFIFGFHGLER